jgi:hypothetical protein
MRWFSTKDLRSTIYAIFSVSTAAASRPPDPGSTLESIRQAMLDLTALDPSDRGVFLARRIRYASDLQALWFMRGELMALLARTHGEAAALEKVDSLSSLFADLLPRGLRSRPSPLSSTFRGRPPAPEE